MTPGIGEGNMRRKLRAALRARVRALRAMSYAENRVWAAIWAQREAAKALSDITNAGPAKMILDQLAKEETTRSEIWTQYAQARDLLKLFEEEPK